METYKGVMILLDGLGDRPSKTLQDRTPLEAAETPHMDRLVASGMGGLVSLFRPWVPVDTQTGMGLLLGLPRKDIKNLTRGPVEAAGVGLPLHHGDVALRCNFATVRPNGSRFDIVDRRAGRITEDTDALCLALDAMALGDGITTKVRAATEHRFVLGLQGLNLSDAVTDTDPGAGRGPEGVQWCQPRDIHNTDAIRTAKAINTFIRRSHERLAEHPVNKKRVADGLLPANGLVTRGAGRVMPLNNLVTHVGLQAAIVTGESTVRGLGRLFGFDVIQNPQFTGSHTTDLEAKVAATRTALENHGLVFLHIKGTDIHSHDRNPLAKKTLLEAIDSAIAPLLKDDLVVAVTGDHSTDSTWGIHIGDPVPALLSAPHIRRDDVQTFSEIACLRGGLGRLSATSFLCAFLDHMNRMYAFRPHDDMFL